MNWLEHSFTRVCYLAVFGCMNPEETPHNTSQKKSEETADNPSDYYLENGLVVFTSKYLKERGYCCHCGCKNCPYKLKEELSPNPTKLKKK